MLIPAMLLDTLVDLLHNAAGHHGRFPEAVCRLGLACSGGAVSTAGISQRCSALPRARATGAAPIISLYSGVQDGPGFFSVLMGPTPLRTVYQSHPGTLTWFLMHTGGFPQCLQ